MIVCAVRVSGIRLSQLKLEMPSAECSDGRFDGVFVLYNYARLSNILRKYQQEIQTGLPRLTYSSTRLLTHSPAHAPTRSLPHSLTHSPTHSPTHSLTHPLTHLLTHFPTCSPTYLYPCFPLSLSPGRYPPLPELSKVDLSLLREEVR